ncbi:MAG: proline--tRNA ligase [Chloroflexi bacterium]|nr:proline--tRNA ligase [Chloroflexota bacterium]
MLFSKLLGKTLRQPPAEAEIISHQLLVRAGMIHQLAAGVYCLLPLGWRVLHKIQQIIREEMDAAGGQELSMPVLQPRELWQESGRDNSMGEVLFRLRDRREREMVLGPTHEEVITLLVRHNVRSYRDLPMIPYQIQTKFRDEPRPRGGLVRVREFVMKDAYSFDVDEEGLDRSYEAMKQAYVNIFQRCGLPALMVEADSGAIGGKASHEFMLLAESGEDVVIRCQSCGYAANAEKAQFAKPPVEKEPEKPLQEVHTPGKKTIADLAAFLGVPASKTAKAVFYAADGRVVFVSIRGDLEVNEIKLKNALKATELRLATDAEVAAAGLVAGSASAVGLRGIQHVADDSILLGNNFVVGANKADYHLLNANYPRDFQVDLLTDIALAKPGHRCAQCGGQFTEARGIEVGHIFKLGTAYSEALGAVFLDAEDRERPIIMGCYGIGVGRLLAAAVEQNHDERGIIWPPAIAPYQVYLCALNMDTPEVSQQARELYQQLQQAGVQVLFDDRVESAGVKFNDADLLGLPLRVTISPRTLAKEAVEVKARTEREATLVPLADAVDFLKRAG